MEQKAEQNMNVEKTDAEIRALFQDVKVLLYCFYPKKAIKVTISVIMIHD